jgi:hypothetical protein
VVRRAIRAQRDWRDPILSIIHLSRATSRRGQLDELARWRPVHGVLQQSLLGEPAKESQVREVGLPGFHQEHL